MNENVYRTRVFLLSREGKKYLLEEYVHRQRSMASIAREQKVYVPLIRRCLIFHGITRRSKAEAQKLALETGRHKHPTKGRPRRESTKRKISKGVYQAWIELDPEIKNLRIHEARQRWQTMSSTMKSAVMQSALKGALQAAHQGSRLEKILKKYLGERRQVLSRVRLDGQTVSLFLPEDNVCILVDGPSHFLPWWGEDHLQKITARDQEKQKKLFQMGYSVIRVKYLSTDTSKFRLDELIKTISDAIEQSATNQLTLELEV